MEGLHKAGVDRARDGVARVMVGVVAGGAKGGVEAAEARVGVEEGVVVVKVGVAEAVVGRDGGTNGGMGAEAGDGEAGVVGREISNLG